MNFLPTTINYLWIFFPVTFYLAKIVTGFPWLYYRQRLLYPSIIFILSLLVFFLFFFRFHLFSTLSSFSSSSFHFSKGSFGIFWKRKRHTIPFFTSTWYAFWTYHIALIHIGKIPEKLFLHFLWLFYIIKAADFYNFCDYLLFFLVFSPILWI